MMFCITELFDFDAGKMDSLTHSLLLLHSCTHNIFYHVTLLSQRRLYNKKDKNFLATRAPLVSYSRGSLYYIVHVSVSVGSTLDVLDWV